MADSTTAYAPEYSQANQASLVNSYNALQDPAAETAKRKLAQTLAGTAGMYGGARASGLGQIAAQQQANTGQYAQSLAQTGLQQTAQERLIAEQRAHDDPYSQAALTGQYNGQTTLAGQQVANQANQFNQSQAQQNSQFTQSQAQTNALQNRAMDLQKEGMDANTAMQKAQMEQQNSQFGQTLNQNQSQFQTNADLAKFNSQMPYLTSGNLDSSGKVTTDAQLNEQSPENKLAQSLLGPNANALQLSQLASSDPSAYQTLLKTGKLPSDYSGGSYGSSAAAATPKSGK